MRSSYRSCLAALALIAASPSIAAPRSFQWKQWLFQRLASHPEFETSIHKEQALILKQGEKYYAAFVLVKSADHPLQCAYAAAIDPAIGTEPGSYVLKPGYICDDSGSLQTYTGLFEVKYPWCGGEVCPNPAIGVGNLLVLPDYDFSQPLEHLPVTLPVRIDGRITHSFDPNTPVAGVVSP